MVPANVQKRFWEKVDKSGECWEWTGVCKETGYGQFHLLGKTARSHRVSWMIANGPVPDGLSVLHRCDNPRCVRPEHLFLGSQHDNLADMSGKSRQSGPRKLTPEQAREIAASKERGVDLAARFGVSAACISMIRRGHTYRTVTARTCRTNRTV